MINNLNNITMLNNTTLDSNNNTTVTSSSNNTTNNSSNNITVIYSSKQQQQQQQQQQYNQNNQQSSFQKQQQQQNKNNKQTVNDNFSDDSDDDNDDDDNSGEQNKNVFNLSPRTLKKLGELSLQTNMTSTQLPWLSRLQHNAKKRAVPIAKLPVWCNSRPFLNNGYLSNNGLLFDSKTAKPSNSSTNISTQQQQQSNAGGLDGLTTLDQEYYLLEDLLYVMIGLEGKYIHVGQRKPDRDTGLVAFELRPLVRFEVSNPAVDSSMSHLINRILPLASYYTYIADFIDSRQHFEWGIVNHSLCESISELIKDYHLLIAQMESQLRSRQLSLQRLWFYIQPTMKIFERLYIICEECTKLNLHGAQILNLLLNSMASYGSDPKTNDFYKFLIQKTSKPFLVMLESWIYRGVVNDPHCEFMIEENIDLVKENINRDYNDAYWDLRYTLQEKQIPKFLEREKTKILLTGKYLNVIRECGHSIEFVDEGKPFFVDDDDDDNQQTSSSSTSTTLQYSANEKHYLERIERAYDFASSKLLTLMNERQLMDRLKSLKYYFLLSKGDFFSHFMEITAEELSKPLSEISIIKMNSLLQLSLRTSSIEKDSFKDDLECEFQSITLHEQLLKIIHIDDRNIIDQKNQEQLMNQRQNANSTSTSSSSIAKQIQQQQRIQKELLGRDSLAFNYKVIWPLSLVINRKSLVKYQIIFRHLFLCKHVEKLLCNTWNQHQESRRAFNNKPALAALMSFSHFPRHRMIHFLQNLEYYMMLEVIEPNWIKMRQSIKNSKTVDEVIKVHDDFLETCLAECMLTDTRLVTLLMKFMTLCIIFCDFNTKMVLEENQFDINAVKKTIQSFETKFHKILKLLIDTLKTFSTTESNRHMIHLIRRLDYNGYYSSYFDQQHQQQLQHQIQLQQQLHSMNSTRSSATTSLNSNNNSSIKRQPQQQQQQQQSSPSSTIKRQQQTQQTQPQPQQQVVNPNNISNLSNTSYLNTSNLNNISQTNNNISMISKPIPNFPNSNNNTAPAPTTTTTTKFIPKNLEELLIRPSTTQQQQQRPQPVMTSTTTTTSYTTPTSTKSPDAKDFAQRLLEIRNPKKSTQ
ncbi:spindle pole body component 97 [Heterostelium album PN500]|uniref:Spindle pole body component n=1 Tax=Heterostelium pallidum (strain ATCC 26659 / Pp 5 / PN500) TaxID=670386 RepID=D3BGP9_HETP5|nr:spindle pole body component 97 [Heterostelium album PN500]EFA79283.1 spindle pole body component 97 [Heterostelium album PN500]|eukprot:XP_020431404.1 spindle pole body component 97 [Heterostelium album PN500]